MENQNKTTKRDETLNIYISGNDPKTLKTEFPDKCVFFTKQSAYSYNYFNSIDHCQKTVKIWKKWTFSGS